MMVVDKDDLGLSLSLSVPHQNNHSLHLNLMPSLVPSSVSSSSAPSAGFNPQKPSWTEAFPSSGPNSDSSRNETRSFLRGIDVNRLPSTVDCEDEVGVSSPNSTISSISRKRSEREGNGEEHEMERACSRGISDEEDGDTSRKKLRLSK